MNPSTLSRLLFTLVLLIPVKAFADPAAGGQENFMGVFADDSERSLKKTLSKLEANPYEMDYVDSTGLDQRWDPKGDEYPEEQQGGQQPPQQNQGQTYAKPMQHPLAFLDSVSGFGETMQSQAYADMAADLVNSPNTVQFITWYLTEPGIASGHNAAMTQANLQLSNRFMADQSLQGQFKLFPEWGDRLAKAYFNCIAKALSSNQGQQGAQQGGQNAWVAAQAKCAGDSYTPKNGGGNAQANQQGAIFTNSPKTFTLIDDPNADQQQNQQGGGQNQSKVLLTDYVFGPTPQGGTNTPQNGQNDQDGDSETYKTAFRSYIGDAEILFQPAQGGSQGGQQGGRAFKITYQKKPPTKITTQEMYGQLFSGTYTRFKDAMKDICIAREKQNSGAPGTGGGAAESTFEQGSGATTQNNYLREMANQCKAGGGSDPCQNASGSGGPTCCKIRKLDILGQKWSILDFDFLYRMLEPKMKNKSAAGATNKCDNLYFDTQETGAKLNGQQGLLKNPENVTNPARLMYFLAKKVAIAKMLASYMKAEEAVLKATGGAFPTAVRELALNLVYENAGTSSLHDAYSTNLDELRRALVQLPMVSERLSGRGGQAVGNSMRGSGHPELPAGR